MSAGQSDASPFADERTIPAAFAEYADEPLAQAPAGGPGKNGLLEAVFAREDDGPTRLIRDRVEVPYHLTGTLETDPAPGLTTLVAQEPTGGVAQGDRHRMVLDARSSARVHVTTQSATKVHSMRENYAHLDATIRAKAGSYLEYLPGPTIVNEDARCLQTVDVDLAEGAVVVLSDVLVPDGLSDHEPFDFDHYHARVEATVDDRLVCADAVDLRPDDRDPRDPASVGEFGVVGSLYVFAPGSGGESGDGSNEGSGVGVVDQEELVGTLHDRITDRPGVEAAVSRLPFDAGAIVRVLGESQADVSQTVRTAWDETRRAVLGVGTPADRRY
ncbi:urease accessory protein UreD [Natrialba sp. INN-245]|uniref:urease accessory protein UreD n=1 Tax=Natrialba sp. INN-245 TaxID=2690967 RepID=UPI0013134157|nr:urease accessory protein UreD [Natrialba sp. INN-245]